MGVVAIAFTSAVMSTAVTAHTPGGALVDGKGNPVGTSAGQCVTVSDGSYRTKCLPQAKAAAKAPAAPAPAPAPVKVTLAGDALFATNSDKLSDQGKATLNEFVARAESVSLTAVDVVGHADSRGEADYNLDLSVRRAATVKSYLAKQGIYGAIISASGKGETQPVASNDTREGRAKNRRVDITIKGTKK